MHQANVLDYYGSNDEYRDARKKDIDTHWDLIPESDIENHPYTFCFVDPESWCYYLPAYMIWTIRNYRTTQSFSKASTVYALNSKYNKDIFKFLSVNESEAVFLFLNFVVLNKHWLDCNAANEALQMYWNQFPTSLHNHELLGDLTQPD